MTDLKLFNSLTRELQTFEPVHEGEARVYSCGPTVYNYQHIGNMRAYVFADTLGRVLSYKGYKLTHVINITDVGHLTSDADAGDDKMEKAAAAQGKTAWDIAAFYQADFEADLARLNIRKPAHPKATEYVDAMIEWGKEIADKHCYELESGLYFDVSTVPEYGRLSGTNLDKVTLEAVKAAEASSKAAKLSIKAITKHGKAGFDVSQELQAAKQAASAVYSAEKETKAAAKRGNAFAAKKGAAATAAAASAVAAMAVAVGVGEISTVLNLSVAAETFGRIEDVDGKHNAADFAIWRKTPPGETRQMEWPSPWGIGAPGWHLECSVMSKALLGMPFDIHTGGIDHREIHHPNEIAQNQAHEGCADSGARIWMHNNFLVERSGKMSKSSGEFLRLQLLIDKGFHPLAFRLMCLQAHYRSELEFSWEGLQAAFVRLKRMVMGVTALKGRHAELVSASIVQPSSGFADGWTLKQVQGDESIWPRFGGLFELIDGSACDDLNTPGLLLWIQSALELQDATAEEHLSMLGFIDQLLGLNLLTLTRQDLRIRPKAAVITEVEIESALAARKEARAKKDFATSDRIRDDLIAKGVEVMDGDPLGWDWKLDI